jgi:hypothetical protein
MPSREWAAVVLSCCGSSFSTFGGAIAATAADTVIAAITKCGIGVFLNIAGLDQVDFAIA